MVRYYGPPSIFYTLTQDNIHGLLNLRMSLPLMYNWSFIATENGFAEALRQQKLEFQTISISESGLRMLLANGLMAAGDVFKTSMKALFSDLLCTPSDESKKKNNTVIRQTKRHFRYARRNIWCQGRARGSLHMHILFWGGLPPALLQAVGGMPGLIQHVTSAINKVVTAELEPIVQVRHLLRDINDDKPAHASLFKCHNPIRKNKHSLKMSNDCQFGKHP